MGIIGSVIESLFTDFIKKEGTKAYQNNRGCFRSFFYGIGVLAILFVWFVIWIISSLDDHENEVWANVEVGDSLFVRSTYGIHFHKKGKTKLSDYEQRKIKYAREDTMDFEWVNKVPDKYFFKNKTSFIGMCIGLDSTQATFGDKWIMIAPSYSITNPPEPKGQFDYEARKWENRKKNLDGFILSDEFFVSASDVALTNNDKEFQ